MAILPNARMIVELKVAPRTIRLTPLAYPVCVNLHQARLKIERADHHIDKLEARIMELYETDHSMVKVDPKSGEETLIHDFSDPAFFLRMPH